MRNMIPLRTIAAFALLIAVCLGVYAENDKPVRIVFDKNAKRTDIVTGKTLPDYTQAERGSFQFFFGRLDKPERGFWYFFDGRRFQSIDRVALMRHMQPQGLWAILGGGGWQGNEPQVVRTNPVSICEIQHHVVSFIPLDLKTGKPDKRVYVLLDDLHLIEWYPVDHWIGTATQEEYEALKGVMY